MQSMRVLSSLAFLGIALIVSHGEPESRSGVEPSESWIASAQREIAEREYQASVQAKGLQAPNRAHDFRKYFDSTGIRVHDRTRPGSPELASLRLSGIGRSSVGGAVLLEPVAPGSVSSEGNRVEVQRSGIKEWYVNTKAGLEQGFTLEVPPAGGGSLILELAVDHAHASLLGEGVVLASSRRRLGFSKLEVFDANARRVAAHFEVPDERRIRMVVADEGATYPLVIDPLLTAAPDSQIEGDQASSLLGYSVAGAGDVNGDGFGDVVVGALLYDGGEMDEGAAFLFLGSAAGIASGGVIVADAVFESNQAGASLGSRVTSAGDVNGDGFGDLLIGAYAYDAGETDEGVFFVYHGSPAGIPSGGPLDAVSRIESNQEGGALFSGASAGDIDGDGFGDLILGAANYEATPGSGMDDSGAAFVFLGSPTGIASGDPTTAATRLFSQQGNEFYGAVVSSAGDVNGDGFDDVIVGAPFADAGNLNAGAAYVYLGSATGIADGAPLTASTILEGTQAGAELGFSVDSAGDVNGDGYSDVIVGAIAYDSGQGFGEGSALVFHGSPTGIASGSLATAAARIDANQAGANLGNSVAGAGDVNGDGYADIVVGAYAFDGAVLDAGVALVFLGSASGVSSGDPSSAFAKLESNLGGNFGFSVDSAGDVNGDGYGDVITGAYTFDSGQGPLEGSAFVFHGGAEGVRDGDSGSAAARLDSGGQDQAGLGFSVSGAGDVNGDGYADVIIGAPRFDSGHADEGIALVLIGGAEGIESGDPGVASALLESNQEGALFGQSVSGAGDVNGDGYADVIVGAFLYDAGHTNEGAAFVFHGSAAGVMAGDPSTVDARLESDQFGAGMGISVSDAGDVNADGYADVIVGAYGYSAGESGEGAAFVFLGGQSGIGNANPQAAVARLESDQSNAQLGYSVSRAGDVNGDGFSDVIVGAHRFNGGLSREGAAFIFLGGAGGVENGNPTTAATRIESNQAGAELGFSVGAAGDVNGDGFGDVIVGAPEYNSLFGAAFVFNGSLSGVADGTPMNASTALFSEFQAFFGYSVDGAGDLNGDGYADLVVGAITCCLDPIRVGAAFTFLGSEAGVASGNLASAASQLNSPSPISGGSLGFSVSGAGDVNGDGYADLVIGAPTQRDVVGEPVEGAAFILLGNADGEGRSVVARQVRTDATNTPIQLGGWTGGLNAGSFEARIRATHPQGRGRVKLEVETCPEGEAFGDIACTQQTNAAWTDVTATSGGVELSETVDNLAADTRYRWRARVLYAPYSVTRAGVVSPPNPPHGPWRRISGSGAEADLLPEPGVSLSLAIGAFLLRILSSRRDRSRTDRPWST